jgi:hypothetical protein
MPFAPALPTYDIPGDSSLQGRFAREPVTNALETAMPSLMDGTPSRTTAVRRAPRSVLTRLDSDNGKIPRRERALLRRASSL